MDILIVMGKWKRTYGYLTDTLRLLGEKKCTTLAGTLVFFLLMSMVPMLFWATLLLGKFSFDVAETFALPGMDEVSGLLDYVRQEAQNATSGASVFLLITSLYSATNLFYQMRKSGEIIYQTSIRGQGLKTRLGAVVLLFLVLSLVVLTVLAFSIFSFFLSRLLDGGWQMIVRYLLLATLAFLLVLFLNLYVCPYTVSAKRFVLGSLLTVVAWAISIVGFGVYLKIGNLSRLYGALSAVIVFLLWLYVLTVCFVAGVIFNSRRVLSICLPKKDY